MRALRLLALLAAAPALALAQVTVVPANPYAFDALSVRIALPCDLDPNLTAVIHSGGSLSVRTTGAADCSPVFPSSAPATRVVELRLGEFPAGTLRVDVSILVGGDMVFAIGAPFTITVAERPGSIPPGNIPVGLPLPPKRPASDHAGAWWVPSESGWGLSLQHAGDGLFGQLFVYRGDSQPAWYTLQGGGWKSGVRWEGSVYETTGPGFASPVFDPARVTLAPVGTAVLDFDQAPATIGEATLTYTIGGTSVTKRIRRLVR